MKYGILDYLYEAQHSGQVGFTEDAETELLIGFRVDGTKDDQPILGNDRAIGVHHQGGSF